MESTQPQRSLDDGFIEDLDDVVEGDRPIIELSGGEGLGLDGFVDVVIAAFAVDEVQRFAVHMRVHARRDVITFFELLIHRRDVHRHLFRRGGLCRCHSDGRCLAEFISIYGG